jgi:hypothetical protein
MLLVVSLFLILGARLLAATTQRQADSPAAQTPPQSTQTNSKHPASGHETIKYVNTEYRFTFLLPRSWKGYSILARRWEDNPQDEVRQSGPEITIRHPQWTDEHQRQDFTIMVFTHAQWNSLQHGDFAVSAASIGPGEIGRNRKYVFAVPPRMIDSDNLYGWEEVVRIMQSNPLRAF